MTSQKDRELTRRSVFFRNITDADFEEALTAMNASVKAFEKGELILHAGEPTKRMGLVLAGSVTIESNDLWGSRTILSHAGPGEFFAETYAMLPDEVMLVDVAANEDCRILSMDLSVLRVSGLTLQAKSSGLWREALTRNLLNISLRKNLTLSGRSFHTAPHAVRDRVMSYLNTVALRAGSNSFSIPFDRQQMADYLNVERTALSKELGRMRDDGLITFRKNRFTLHGE